MSLLCVLSLFGTCRRPLNLLVNFPRLFKFPQMDFEMAIWEMTSLLIAPKKVFRSIYYHVWTFLLSCKCDLRAYISFAETLDFPSTQVFLVASNGPFQRRRIRGTDQIPPSPTCSHFLCSSLEWHGASRPQPPLLLPFVLPSCSYSYTF